MFLQRIEIRHLRSIDHIELDFSTSRTNKMRRRTVLLGENGCGKSTALRGIALLLAGSAALAELLKNPQSWVRNNTKEARITGVLRNKEGQEREVTLLMRPEWDFLKTLKQNSDSLAELDAALDHTPRNYFVLGYGVTRRPASASKEFSQRGDSTEFGPRTRGLATLFSADTPLVSLEQWAMDLEYRHGNNARSILAPAMRKLLPGMKFEGIDRKRREMIFKTVDGSVPFQQLSDGYQNMANWCGDVLYRITNTFDDYKEPLKTRGVLLIDELDLHLHPVWQRRLTGFLRTALPNMQIVATSHSPIIAQQLREGELYVVERPSRRRGARVRAIVGDPSRLTLPQLMSPMFGIDTVNSVRIAKLRRKARESKGRGVSKAEAAELAEVAPLDELPPAMQAQLLAAEKVVAAVSHATNSRPPTLDKGTLRARIKQPLTFGPAKKS